MASWPRLLEALQSWLGSVAQVNGAHSQAADGCLGLLVEMAQQPLATLAPDRLQEFEETFLSWRRSLQPSDCGEVLSSAVLTGFVELAARPESADLRFYRAVAQSWAVATEGAQGWSNLSRSWQDYLASVGDCPEQLDSRQVLASHAQYLEMLDFFEGTSGPTDWPMLNAVLNSGSHRTLAARWFVEELRKQLVFPQTTNLVLRQHARALHGVFADLVSLVERSEAAEVSSFNQDLSELGLAFRTAHAQLQDLMDRPPQVRCMRCSAENSPDRNLCGQCGMRLIRDVSQFEVVSLVDSQRVRPEGELPKNVVDLYDALEQAEGGYPEPLAGAIARFLSGYDPWKREVQQAIKGSQIGAKGGHLQEFVEFAQAIVDELDICVGVLRELQDQEALASLSQIRQELEQIVHLIEQMRLFKEDLAALS